MNLFDNEFYPSPKEVIRLMAEPYADRLDTATVLEPSAGNGAILDYICNDGIPYDAVMTKGHTCRVRACAHKENVYAIEHNPELQMILHQKGYRVIASDFLAFWPEHRFDLILMNPPFSAGVRHLLHAWEILPGGDIACLLNAESLRNPCTSARERLKVIVEEHGTVEYLGRVFADSDNATDVEVALVRLHKDSSENPFRIDMEQFSSETMPDFGELAVSSDSLATDNRIEAYIRCWNLTKAAASELIRSYGRFLFFASAFAGNRDPMNDTAGIGGCGFAKDLASDMAKLASIRPECLSRVYNRFLDDAKSWAWNTIFSQIGLGRYMTTGLKNKLDEFRTAQGAMEISKDNINSLFRYIMANIGTIMDGCVTEVYDLFTRFYKGNTSHDEGWKTNKRYRCNRKIVVPGIADAGYMPQKYGYSTFFKISYRADMQLDDIDKAMCWLEGRNFDALNADMADDESRTIRATIPRIRVGDQGWHNSAFFRVRAFKKGTVHLEFRDEALWTKFNLAVNQGKNRIGETE